MVPVSRTIPEAIVREHVARLVELMRGAGVDAVLLFDASNMLAFTGTPHHAWDRLTCGAVTREGGVIVVCPRFERPAVRGAEPLATIHTWEETKDPYAAFARALAAAGVRGGSVALDGRTWCDAAARFERACAGVRFVPGEHLLREVRICKSPAEQELLRAAHRAGERLFLAFSERLRAGASELELHREMVRQMAEEGVAADPMIQSGENAAIPHNPTGERVVREGDMVVVDSVVVRDGYMNDLTRTFAVGRPGERGRRAYRAVRAAQAAAIAAARPGATCAEVDRAARRVIEAAGFGAFFTHRVGHGIGIECHEPPYLNGANEERLRPGMCVTIEPGVYVPGEFGVRIEDDVLITETGCEVIGGALPTDMTTAFEE